ncbi:MAG: hypothetical protein ACRDBP_16395 [Luteolibacter sp.]
MNPYETPSTASTEVQPASLKRKEKSSAWSWKAFFIHLLVLFVLGLAAAYGISKVFEQIKPELKDPQLTVVSMVIGGALAPILLAALAGWRSWHLGPFLVSTAVVASLYGSSIVVGVVAVILSTGVYAFSRKVGQVLLYYTASTSAATADAEAQQVGTSNGG